MLISSMIKAFALRHRATMGGRLFTFNIRKDGTDMLVKIFEQGTWKQN
jgi:hypothetical protein